jgi:transposase
MNKKYRVCLSDEERDRLRSLVGKGTGSAYRIKHANILLLADEDSGWSDERIAKAISVHSNTVGNVRKRLVEQGLDAALERKIQENPSRERKLDGRGEAFLIAEACSSAPRGRKRWTLRLLASRLVELEVVDKISHEAVRQVLKKAN